MKKKIPFLILSLLFLSCAVQKPGLGPQLSRNWKFENIYSESGDVVKKVGPNDFFYLLPGGKFEYRLFEAGIHSKGNWLEKDSILILTYEPKVQRIALDSSVWIQKPEGPVLEMFSGGKKLGYLDSGGLHQEKVIRAYQIRELSSGKLLIFEKGVYYSFKY